MFCAIVVDFTIFVQNNSVILYVVRATASVLGVLLHVAVEQHIVQLRCSDQRHCGIFLSISRRTSKYVSHTMKNLYLVLICNRLDSLIVRGGPTIWAAGSGVH